MLLDPADKPLFFPDVDLAGDALTGAIVYAQALAESAFGANRPLELQQYVLTLPVQAGRVFLPFSPVSISSVEIRGGAFLYDGWGRFFLDWQMISADSWELDSDIGQILLRSFGHEARVTFDAGYDFSGTDPPVPEIKSCVGRVLSHIVNNRLGLSSYQADSVDSALGIRYERFDQILVSLLMPLKKYASR